MEEIDNLTLHEERKYRKLFINTKNKERELLESIRNNVNNGYKDVTK